MRGRIENRFVDSTVCLSERPLIRLAALDTFSPKGRRLWRSPGKLAAPPVPVRFSRSEKNFCNFA